MGFIAQPQTLLAVGPARTFGNSSKIFSGYVTVTENTIDAIEITQQPVQQGASIADHAFKKPISFSISIQFQSSFTQSLSNIYQQLLTLQSTFSPVIVTSPKRTYPNMLISALGVTTEKRSENILSVNVTFQEVILVPIVSTIVPRSQLKNAGSNGGTQPVGQKQSAFFSAAQGLGFK